MKALCIVGATATGKSSLALTISQRFDADIISIDTRQMYSRLTIGTGKDIPPLFVKKNETVSLGTYTKTIPYYTDGKTGLWGYDLFAPTHLSNVVEFLNILQFIFKAVEVRKRFPILVGGSGHYVKSIFYPPQTFGIPPNDTLRDQLSGMTVSDLQNALSAMSCTRLSLMNESDKANPRRLIRAIEIEKAKSDGAVNTKLPSLLHCPVSVNDTCFIGLSCKEKSATNDLIDRRVESRIFEGFDAEVQALYKEHLYDEVLKNTLGYNRWIQYLDGECSKADAIVRWKTDEHSYAKRQMTWFRTFQNITWFNPCDTADRVESVQKAVEWYTKYTTHAKN